MFSLGNDGTLNDHTGAGSRQCSTSSATIIKSDIIYSPEDRKERSNLSINHLSIDSAVPISEWLELCQYLFSNTSCVNRNDLDVIPGAT